MTSAYRSPAGAERVRDWCSAGLARWEIPHATHEVHTSCGQTHVVALGTGDGICIYLPGQPGLSAAKRPHPELSGYAAWLSDLIAWVRERHAHGRIVLAGHSRGAAVALSAEPDSVQGLILLAPAGLTEVRASIAMLRATLPWLMRRNSAGARRLLEYMSGLAHTAEDDLVEWMTLVARTCRPTGAPGPLPDDTLLRWKGRQVLVVVGERDVFFPITELREPCRSKLGREPLVIPGAGHLLLDERPVLVTELITSLL